MTDQATRVVPAGWYEDPASPAHVRWWNGLAWTEHTALKPAQQPASQPVSAQGYGQQNYQQAGQGGYGAQQSAGSAQDAAAQAAAAEAAAREAAVAARIAEARELERQYGISTAEHEIIVSRAADIDTGSTEQVWSRRDLRDDYRRPDFDDEPPTATASAWFLALWPVLTLVGLVAAAYVAFFITPEPAVAGIPVVFALALVPYLLSIVWAVTDARKLRELGHEPPSPALAILGPLVYLIARRVKVPGSGPLVMLVILTLLAAAVPVGAFATGFGDRLATTLEIQQAVRTKYVDGGQLASVNCLPLVVESFPTGAIYTCDGVTPEGSAKSVWVAIDADHAFSIAIDLR